MEFATDRLFDDPPSAITGLDLVEMTVDNSRLCFGIGPVPPVEIELYIKLISNPKYK
jgi:hypothetical protein